jgi:hypothetical protein
MLMRTVITIMLSKIMGDGGSSKVRDDLMKEMPRMLQDAADAYIDPGEIFALLPGFTSPLEPYV